MTGVFLANFLENIFESNFAPVVTSQMNHIKGVAGWKPSQFSKLSVEVQQQIEIFIRQLLQQIFISNLSWPPTNTLLNPLVQEILYIELFEPENLKYPFPISYELRVLKALVARIESNIRNPNEEVWSLPRVAFCCNSVKMRNLYHSDAFCYLGSV